MYLCYGMKICIEVKKQQWLEKNQQQTTKTICYYNMLRNLQFTKAKEKFN